MNALPSQREFRDPLPDVIESEVCILGSLFMDNAIFWKVAGILKPHHFSDAINREVYEIASKMISENRVANPLTIKPHLPPGVMVGEKPLFLHVIEMQRHAMPADSAVENARAVRDMWGRRQLSECGQWLDQAARAMTHETTNEALITELSGHVARIGRDISEGTKAITMADAVDAAIQSIQDAFKFKKRVGVTTGVDSVDQLTGPWEPGQQIIIGGGTKQGKTALALQCAVGLALHGPVWIYSGEMSVKQLAMREIGRRTGIPVWKQKEGRISQAEWARLGQVQEEVHKLPILIEKRRLTLEQIHQQCREIKMERGLAAVMIDHVGLLAWNKEYARKDEWEQSQIATRELKAIYEDLGVPGMSLVQLKKNTFATDYRGRSSFADRMREAVNRRPKYTDMMGAVERDADHVIIPFNARPILAGIEPDQGSDDHIIWEGKMEEHQNKAEIILALSREQQFPKRREVEWHGETTSFGPAFVGRQESLLPEGF